MRITAKQYALSLYESVYGKTAGEAKPLVKKFVELLVKKNKITLEDKIIKEFDKTWNKAAGLVEVEITSAGGLNKEMAKLLKSYVAKLSGAKEIAVQEKIDKTMLGGVIIKYGDKVLDGSLKNGLAELREKLIR